MHHGIDFMLALIDLSIYFCRMPPVFSEGKRSLALLWGSDNEDDNEMGATPAGSDARMATRAAAAVDH